MTNDDTVIYMNNTTATPTTPTEIDAAIADAAWNAHKAASKLDDYEFDAQRGRTVTQDEIDEANEALNAAITELKNLEALYTGWNRYFIVRNNGGHIHNSTSCSSCFPTTDFGWLTNLSGSTITETVEAMGETMCSICFPGAPTGGKSKISAAVKAAKADIAAARKIKEVKAMIAAIDKMSYNGPGGYNLRSAQDRIDWAIRNNDTDRQADAEAHLAKLNKAAERLAAKLPAKIEAGNAALEAAGFPTWDELQARLADAEKAASDKFDMPGAAFTR